MKIPNQISSNAHWLLRAALASVFIFHGLLKLSNLQGFADMLPISYGAVVLIALMEASGGLLVLAGGFGDDVRFDWATRVGALLNIPTMLGAVAMVHWGRWNFVPSESHPMGGMQFHAVLILLMLYVAVIGNGGLRRSETAVPVDSGFFQP